MQLTRIMRNSLTTLVFQHPTFRSCGCIATTAHQVAAVAAATTRSCPTAWLAPYPRSTVSARFAVSSSSFNPPVPPSSKGQAVYPNVKLSNQTWDSSRRNLDENAVFVVNGSSRGIGLQFVKSIIGRTKGKVVACCRSPEDARGLNDFLLSLEKLDQRHRVHVLQLDVEDQSTIDAVADTIKDTYGRVDCLFNVAGILGDGTTTPGPERALSKVERRWAERSMEVNCIGPLMLAQALAPMMRSRGRRGSTSKAADSAMPTIPNERAKTVIVNLSARVGSISDNQLGGWYSYRISKAALNQATRTMSHELKRQGILTISLHPGTTDTDLSRPFQRNVQEGRLFPVEFTVGRLLDVVDSMTEEHSGGFFDWAGLALPY